MGKNLNNKYGQKVLDSAKESTTDAIKAIQKTAETTGDLIGNKIADKITSISTKNDDANSEIEVGRTSPKDVPKKIHISRTKATNYWWIKVSVAI